MIARFPMLMLVLLAALILSACGGDDSSGDEAGSGDGAAETEAGGDDSGTDAGDDGGNDAGSGGGTDLELGVDGNKLEFDKEELEASAGPVTITLTNTSSIPHNVAIETEDGETLEEGEVVGEGKTSEVSVELEPGTYRYYCTPHKSAGMKGTLTVT